MGYERGLAFWLLLVVAPLGAQDIPFDYSVVDTAAIGHRDVGDIDGDGLADIVAVDFLAGDNRVLWYRYPDWARFDVVHINGYADFQIYRSDDVALGDIDRDGDVDIVGRVGPSSDADGIIVWWENPLPGGDPSLGDWARHDIGHSNYIKDLAVVDLDRDNVLDVVGRENQRTYIFRQASPTVWTEERVIDHYPHEGMDVGDLDGDGDPDVVLNGFWLENPSPLPLTDPWLEHDIDSRWWNQTGNGWQDNNSNISVADLDNDLRLDVVLSQSELPGYPLSWYSATDPRNGPWTEHVIEPVFDWCQTVQTGDVDLDGNIDVLAAMFPRWPAPSYPVRIYRNQGAGLSWLEQDLSALGIYHGTLGDVGSDGDLDVVGLRNYDTPPIELWENKTADDCRRALDQWTYIEIDSTRAKWGDWDTPTWSKYFGLGMGDLTGDGFSDIVSGRYFYRNPGGDMTAPWPRIDFGLNCDASLVVDVDSDALGDVIASAGDVIYWLEAQDTQGSAWNTTVIDPVFPKPGHGNTQGYRLAQIVSGGREEILLNDTSVYMYEIPADPSAGPWPRTAVVLESNGEEIATGDVDRDGQIDIAVGHHPPGWTTTDPRFVKWSKNPGDGSGGWIDYPVGTIDADYPDRIAIGDLNGDGRADIVVTEEEQPVTPDWKTYWFEAPLDPTQSDWTRHVLVSQYTTNSMDVVDMDGDGDLDIVLAEHRGSEKLAIWENDGAGNFIERVVSNGLESHLGARTADLDGDGDLEIASIAWDDYQYLHLWRNDAACRTDPTNRPPLVQAGPDQIVALPDTEALLSATVTDDGLPTGSLTLSWSQTSGPGTASFAASDTAESSVSFDVPGRYVLRLSADDSDRSSFDEVVVTFWPPESGLVLHWPLDDGSGMVARDLTPYANDGTTQNGPVWTGGRVGGALDFDGIQTYVERANGGLGGAFPATAATTGSFTVMAWIELDRLGERNPIASKQGNSQRGFLFMTETDDTLTLELFKDDTTSSSVRTARMLSAGVYAHGAATYQWVADGSSRVRLYIDGLVEGSADDAVGPPRVNSTPFEIGRYYWSPTYSVYLDGRIDDVRVYDRALSQCEIQRIIAGAGGGFEGKDSDVDGMPDTWELDRFGSLLALAAEDADSDGVVNVAEFIEGTSPLDPSDRLVLYAVRNGNDVETRFETRLAAGTGYECEGRSYAVQSAAGDPAGPWVDVGGCEGVAATGAVESCAFTPVAGSLELYRLRASLVR